MAVCSNKKKAGWVNELDKNEYYSLKMKTYERNRGKLAGYEKEGIPCTVLLTTGIMLSGHVEKLNDVDFDIGGTSQTLLSVLNVLPEKQKKFNDYV